MRRIATTESVAGSSRGRAITELVRLKGKDEIPNLKTLLKNESEMMQVWMGNVAGAVNNNVSFQTRDLALAQLVSLTGQNLQEYGFTFRQGIGESMTAAAFGSYAFQSEEARTAAFKKWDAWEKKNDAKK